MAREMGGQLVGHATSRVKVERKVRTKIGQTEIMWVRKEKSDNDDDDNRRYKVINQISISILCKRSLGNIIILKCPLEIFQLLGSWDVDSCSC